MSLSETISPTQERFHKGDRIEAPEYSQSVKRPAFRVLHPFEKLFRDGKINEGCLAAGMKLVRHLQGMHGADVRISEMDGGYSGGGDDFEYPSIRHGSRVTEARAWIIERNTYTGQRRWQGLLGVAEQMRTLEEVGREFRKYTCRKMAAAAGLEVVSQAMEDLAVLWGFSQAYHAKNPPSR
jgi:hypothetical protein